MFVNVAVLKETQPHERRVALVPSVTARLIKLGAELHMQSGAGVASKFADSSFKKDVTFIDDRHKLVAEADVVLRLVHDDDVAWYGRPITSRDILFGHFAYPRATALRQEIQSIG